MRIFIIFAIAVAIWLCISNMPNVATKPRGIVVVDAPSDAKIEHAAAIVEVNRPPQRSSDSAVRPAVISDVSADVLPLLNRLGPDGRVLHDRLVSERRDEAWATKAESDIQTGYNRLEAIGGAGRALNIQCGSTVCQVSGNITDLPKSSASDMLHAVQSLDLQDRLETQGYKLKESNFGKGGKGTEIFVSYFTKTKS